MVKPLKSSSSAVAEKTAVKAKTLRLSPEFEVGLRLLKQTLGTPVNKMVNEAVGEYIQKRTAEIETNLTGVLDQIKAYRRADPHFDNALESFVAAEAKFAGRDPAEGVVYDVEPPAPKSRKKADAGPAVTKVRSMLRG